MKQLTVYLTPNGYAYEGVYQSVGQIPHIRPEEQPWMVLGAALIELVTRKGYKSIKIITNQELAEVYNRKQGYISHTVKKVHLSIMAFLQNTFANIKVEGAESSYIAEQMMALKVK